MQLTFDVTKQHIERTDKEEPVAGSKNYLTAKFTFTGEEWTGTKTAIFKKGNDVKCVILAPDDTCTVPWEVIRPGIFLVSVFCGDLVTANQAAVNVDATGYAEGETPEESTPDVYAQLVAAITQAIAVAQSVRNDADAGEFNGAPGVSPSITVTAITGGYKVTVMDISGTLQEFNILHGSNGISPTVEVNEITGGHNITITDSTGTHDFNVMNGATDVTILSHNLVDKANGDIKNWYLTGTNIVASIQCQSIVIPIKSTDNNYLTIHRNVIGARATVVFTTEYPTTVMDISGIRSFNTYETFTVAIPSGSTYAVIYYYNSRYDTETADAILNGMMVQYGYNYTGYEPYNITSYVPRSYYSLYNMDNVLKTANKPMISIVVDPATGYNEVKAFKTLCDTLGIKTTIGLLTGLLNNPTGVDGETVKSLYLQWQKEGFHITTESTSHGAEWSTTTPNYAMIESDIVQSLSDMQLAGFVDYDYLVAPNGNALPKTKEIASKWVKALMRAAGEDVFNEGYAKGRYEVFRSFIVKDSNGGKGLDAYKADIDRCIAHNGWMVFGLHTLTGNNEYDATLVQNVLQYAIDKGVPIYTFNQAFKIRKPIYDLYEIFS